MRPQHYTQEAAGQEVVHLAGQAGQYRPRQRCARCSAVLVDQGKTYPPGQSVVVMGETPAVWATTSAPTCQAPPIRAHGSKGSR
jgi:hypothetical protein